MNSGKEERDEGKGRGRKKRGKEEEVNAMEGGKRDKDEYRQENEELMNS